MSVHILVIEHDGYIAGPVHVDQHIYPEHVEERSYGIICPPGNRCAGWLGCSEPHICPHGVDAKHGPEDHMWCTEPPLTHTCFCEKDEFEFHGVEHTWRCGFGWTVPYQGCIVQWSDWDWPPGLEETPRGRYEVEDDWDDDTCYIEFTTSPPTEVSDEAVHVAEAV